MGVSAAIVLGAGAPAAVTAAALGTAGEDFGSFLGQVLDEKARVAGAEVPCEEPEGDGQASDGLDPVLPAVAGQAAALVFALAGPRPVATPTANGEVDGAARLDTFGTEGVFPGNGRGRAREALAKAPGEGLGPRTGDSGQSRGRTAASPWGGVAEVRGTEPVGATGVNGEGPVSSDGEPVIGVTKAAGEAGRRVPPTDGEEPLPAGSRARATEAHAKITGEGLGRRWEEAGQPGGRAAEPTQAVGASPRGTPPSPEPLVNAGGADRGEPAARAEETGAPETPGPDVGPVPPSPTAALESVGAAPGAGVGVRSRRSGGLGAPSIKDSAEEQVRKPRDAAAAPLAPPPAETEGILSGGTPLRLVRAVARPQAGSSSAPTPGRASAEVPVGGDETEPPAAVPSAGRGRGGPDAPGVPPGRSVERLWGYWLRRASSAAAETFPRGLGAPGVTPIASKPRGEEPKSTCFEGVVFPAPIDLQAPGPSGVDPSALRAAGAEVVGALPGTTGAEPAARPEPPATVAARPAAPDVPQQLVKAIRIHLGPGRERISVQLEPERLGKVELVLSREADGMTARFRVESPDAHRALAAEAPLLRRELEAQGVSLVRVSVDLDQSAGNGREPKPGRRTARRGAAPSAPPGLDPPEARPRWSRVGFDALA